MSGPAWTNTELTTDPASVGYATPLAAGDHTALAALLNAVGSDVISEPLLTRDAFMLAIAPCLLTLPSKSDAVQKKWDRILAMIRASDAIHLSSGIVQALLAASVTDEILSQDIVDAIGKRPGSRFEVGQGPGSIANESIVAEALRIAV